jgi:serine/threonine protein phosphatase PrpC
MSWKVAHACVRGSSHIRLGLPNQDAAQCTVAPGSQGSIAVAVVSDGHGSARHFRSQIGSSLAVSTVAATLQSFLRESVAGNGKTPFVPEQVHELERKIVSVWLAAVSSDLGENPFSEAELAALEQEEGLEARAEVVGTPELAYGATLLAAGATDRVLLYLQLGDGEILSVAADGTTMRPLPPDERLIANQTTSLCQPEAWRDFRSAWITAPELPSMVLLSTDGYANSFRSDEDFLKIGQDYLEIIRQQGIASLAEELPSILTEATQQGSGDDITLAILQDDQGAGGKVPRQLMTAASKSALIEQLKARHSSQQQKLRELAIKVEQTRSDNRRLRNTLLLVLGAAVAVPLAVFHNHIFPHSPGTAPIAPTMGTSDDKKMAPADQKPAPVQPAQWTLTVDGRQMTIDKKSPVPTRFVHPGAKADTPPDAYATLAKNKPEGPLFLINESSKDVWSVNGKSIPQGHEVPLGEEPFTITFVKAAGSTKAITGTIAPVVAAVPTQP